MQEWTAQTAGGTYQVLIKNGALSDTGRVAAEVCKGRTAVVVTDHQVAPLYLQPVLFALKEAGFTCSDVVLSAGEETKTLQSAAALYAAFHEHRLSRIDPVIALGGGVIGDLAGFAAATWLRGVPLIQVPTTLLAQVDSSIGGKTAVDLPQGKNLVGAFYQPKAVVSDPMVLRSLPKCRIAEGMAEVIKYGLIADAELLQKLERKSFDYEWLVSRCIRIKINIVSRDERDSGERMLLNFGHTIGHAIEKATQYTRYSHGEAVAVGMITAAAVGEQLGMTEKGTKQKIRRLLCDYQLPLFADVPIDPLIQAIYSDKKRLGDQIYFVLLRRPGEAFIQPLDPEKLEQILREVWTHE